MILCVLSYSGSNFIVMAFFVNVTTGTIPVNCFLVYLVSLKPLPSFEPHNEKTCLRGFRPGETQTDLLSFRS